MAEDLKALTKRWFEEVWTKDHAEAIGEMFDPDGIACGVPADGGPIWGAEGLKAFHAAYSSAFPDMSILVEDVIQDDEKCAVRFTGGGTHTARDSALLPQIGPPPLPG